MAGDTAAYAVWRAGPQPSPRLRSDTGSRAAASRDTRANTNAGVGPAFTRDVLVATCEIGRLAELDSR
jgi:hypothetical protein